MRPITTLLGTAVLGASLALAAPAAHAAAGPPNTPACSKATADAQKAESDYNAAKADYEKVIKDGGHPDKSQQDQVSQAEQNMNMTASTAARFCPDAKVVPAKVPSGKVPSGTVHTGAGSTSEGLNGTEIAAGAGLVAVVGAGALVVVRRRRGGQA
jgi:MYXO-CTERM domain-containing protein